MAIRFVDRDDAIREDRKLFHGFVSNDEDVVPAFQNCCKEHNTVQDSCGVIGRDQKRPGRRNHFPDCFDSMRVEISIAKHLVKAGTKAIGRWETMIVCVSCIEPECASKDCHITRRRTSKNSQQFNLILRRSAVPLRVSQTLLDRVAGGFSI